MEPPTELVARPCHCSFSIITQHAIWHLRCRGCSFVSSSRFERVRVKILKHLKKSRPKRLILRYQKINLKSQLSHKGAPSAKSRDMITRNKGMPLYWVTIPFTEAAIFNIFQVDISKLFFDTLELIFLVEIFFKVL